MGTTRSAMFEGVDDFTKPFLPDFVYKFIKVGKENEAALEQIKAMHALMVFKAMQQGIKKRISESDIILLIEEFLEMVIETLTHSNIQQRSWIYLLANTEHNPLKIAQKIHLSQHKKSKFMSALEQLLIIGRAEGEEEGIKVGEARGEARGVSLSSKIIKLHLKSIAAEAIAEKLGCSLDLVQRVITDFETED
jgi:hypothetical protein